MLLFQYVFYGFVAIIAGGFRFSGPIVLKLLINNIKDDNFDFNYSLLLAGIWMLLIFLTIIFDEKALQGFFFIGLKSKGIVTLLLHLKLANLS